MGVCIYSIYVFVERENGDFDSECRFERNFLSLLVFPRNIEMVILIVGKNGGHGLWVGVGARLGVPFLGKMK